MGSKIRKYLNFRAKNQIENCWISVLWVQKSTWIYWQKMIIYPSVNFRIRNFKSAMPGWCSIYNFFRKKKSCIFLVLFFRWICMNLKLEYLWMILSKKTKLKEGPVVQISFLIFFLLKKIQFSMCQTFLSPPFDLIVEKFDDSAMEFFGTFLQFTGRRRGIYFCT